MKIPWGNIGLGFFFIYIINTVSVFYTLYFPVLCGKDEAINCVASKFKNDGSFDFYLVASHSQYQVEGDNTIYKRVGIYLHESFDDNVEIELPHVFVDQNKTIFGHVIVVPTGNDPFYNGNKLSAHYSVPLTSFKVPETAKVNLMEAIKFMDNTTVMLHWKPKLLAHIMDVNVVFNIRDVPPEFRRFIDKTSMQYNPILYADQLSLTRRHDIPLITSKNNVTISFSPITIGKLRIWRQFEEAVENLKEMGFRDDDVDEIKGIFTDTNMYFLTLTFFVTVFHLLFDFLAFKNDVSFWKNRKSTAGLSTRVIIWRCVSQVIIFLYLCDNKTSYIVLGPAGVGVIIEFWKVTKSLKISFKDGKISFGEKSQEELDTEKFDSEAMWYLQWLMWPLVVGGAIYSLLYLQHRSWYSWIVNSLVNGVYCFGFLFMTPQLFLNYKLKSVAHLPWRAFMYKAFNTFIDDVFAFIITMPTAHRLACFRDDIIFLVYLYQRWLYPVDKSRVNEFGQSFDEAEDTKGCDMHQEEEPKKTK